MSAIFICVASPLMLYECHNENSPYDNEQIRTGFSELCQQMNGIPLREIPGMQAVQGS